MNATAPTSSNPGQPQCQFFVVRKKRLCRMTVRPGRQYCGEHEPQPAADQKEVDKRIPCPNDPKHTCYASKLEKHLAKCNARQTEDPPYIVRNLNAPEDEAPTPRVPLKDVPTHTLKLVIEKINELYDKHVSGTISLWQAPEEHHPALLGSLGEAGRSDSSRRHLRQASRLMQLAEERGLVADHTCYVELGAGKGMLSYYIGSWWCGGGSRVVCVDRAALRHKRDNLLRRDTAHRLRADLRHLLLHRAEPVRRARAVVGLAKHLCGVATDYALRCVCGAGARVPRTTRGVLLATCCHHRCERSAYVGTTHLQELGITGEELNIMFGIVSWATCGDGRSREKRLVHTHTTGVTHAAEGDGRHAGTHSTRQTIDTNNEEKQITLENEHNVTDAHVQTKKLKLSLEHNNPGETLEPHNDTGTNDRSHDDHVNDTSQANHSTEECSNIAKIATSETNCNDYLQDTDGESNSNAINQHIQECPENCRDSKIQANRNAEESHDIVERSGESNSNATETTETCADTFVPLDIKAREEVGRRAKALIDYGRVLYLRERGFEASLCYYVPTAESLENVCLVATRAVPPEPLPVY